MYATKFVAVNEGGKGIREALPKGTQRRAEQAMNVVGR
jgi:hypothetical protein